MSLGERVREIRLSKNISTTKLAKMSGVSRGTIDMLEHSRLNDVKLSTLQKVSAALDVDISNLIKK